MKALVLSVCMLIPIVVSAQDGAAPATTSMVPAGDIAWAPLDPAQPDGIQIATISGDPSTGAFEALVRFPPGLDAGLHTHSADHVGVVVAGTLYLGPTAETAVELPVGSYFVQPGGEAHNTRAGADGVTLYLDYEGALDMAPTDTPAPAPASVLVPGASVPWTPMDPAAPAGPQLAVVAGDPATGPSNVLMQFPAGTNSGPHAHTASYSAVVVAGTTQHGLRQDAMVELPAGSFWLQPGGEGHIDHCVSTEPCIFVGKLSGAHDFIPMGQAE